MPAGSRRAPRSAAHPDRTAQRWRTRVPVTTPRQLSLWDAGLPTASAGDLLAAARRRAGWSQRRLAAAAGLSQSRVSRLEAGITDPGLDELVTIARALGRPADRLVGASRVGMRRHARAGRPPATSRSRALVARLAAAGLVGAFLGRGGSLRALGGARAGRQPLSAGQAAIALAVLREHAPAAEASLDA